MNVEEVKRIRPSFPQDIHWGHFAYCKYLRRHSNYKVKEGDVLIFIVGHFPTELTATPLGIFTPDAVSHLLRVGIYKPETHQS